MQPLELFFEDMKGPINPIREGTYEFLEEFFKEVGFVVFVACFVCILLLLLFLLLLFLFLFSYKKSILFMVFVICLILNTV